MIYTPGTHVLLDFHDCLHLENADALSSAIIAAAIAADATVIGQNFHSFPGRAGVTGVVLLAESHISIHTWPEHQFAALDIFMCGNCNPQIAVNHLTQTLQPKRVNSSSHQRGVDHLNQ